ncbi:MAG: DUF2797 domain-containing protein [Deltaproteobacteria bacterium]|nr:DUF2797 domain-containing protein [Candidatus Anaeroferrophillus wilburensis]MBN2888413.1 DUF2797 domain-containing protein [Deltaproteobacteria bacterium]
MAVVAGNLRKMSARLERPVVYQLPVGAAMVELNPHIGRELAIRHTGRINCIACGREIKKTFQQGYCFPCVRSLAACDSCQVKPELCHYAAGTCREPEWGLAHCMQDHYVYLANTSGLKVGITRFSQVPTRWIDQGARQALPMYSVKSRLQSGLVEVVLKEQVSDRTDWRRMLQGDPEPVDLPAAALRLHEQCAGEIKILQEQLGGSAITLLTDRQPVDIIYPVERYPEKVRTYNLDKKPNISDLLLGIKGQYLIFAGGVLNVRKYAGYFVEVGPAD